MKKIIVKLILVVSNILRKYFGIQIIREKERDNIDQTFSYLLKNSIDKNLQITIFDVGTNIGQMLKIFLKLFKDNNFENFQIHCFEPNRKIFSYLEENFNDSKIFLNNLALGENNYEKNFFIHEKTHVLSSFIEHTDILFKTREKYKINEKKVNVITLDEYCAKKKVDKISFLKIDTQGYNSKVLEGSKEILSKRNVDIIFTEIQFGSIYAKIETFTKIEKHLVSNDYEFFGISRDSRTIKHIMSKQNNDSLNFDLIYLKKSK